MVKSKAFTLIEIIVALAIMAVLIVLGLYGASVLQKNSRDKTRTSTGGQIIEQINRYSKIKLSYPDKEDVEFSSNTFRIESRDYYTFKSFTKPATNTTISTTKYFYNKSPNGFIFCILLESGQVKSLGIDSCPAVSTWN